uniref:ARAD1C31064p n=1 Tax=Blastobotrys adeninivorans TaxID=409370 RepID=A0A060T2T5_BLAAD
MFHHSKGSQKSNSGDKGGAKAGSPKHHLFHPHHGSPSSAQSPTGPPPAREGPSGPASASSASIGSPKVKNAGANSAASLAQRYDEEKQRIIKSCFSKLDDNGKPLESYITHVRIIEDNHYPSSKPPPTSPESAKKHRAIVVAVRKSGRVRVHKARENPNGTFQIGKTWNLDELTRIEDDSTSPTGVLVNLIKPYYWTMYSPREKQVFMQSLIKIYRKYTGGKMPVLVGLDPMGRPIPPDALASTSSGSGQSQPMPGAPGGIPGVPSASASPAPSSSSIRQVNTPTPPPQSNNAPAQPHPVTQPPPAPVAQTRSASPSSSSKSVPGAGAASGQASGSVPVPVPIPVPVPGKSESPSGKLKQQTAPPMQTNQLPKIQTQISPESSQGGASATSATSARTPVSPQVTRSKPAQPAQPVEKEVEGRPEGDSASSSASIPPPPVMGTAITPSSSAANVPKLVEPEGAHEIEDPEHEDQFSDAPSDETGMENYQSASSSPVKTRVLNHSEPPPALAPLKASANTATDPGTDSATATAAVAAVAATATAATAATATSVSDGLPAGEIKPLNFSRGHQRNKSSIHSVRFLSTHNTQEEPTEKEDERSVEDPDSGAQVEEQDSSESEGEDSQSQRRAKTNKYGALTEDDGVHSTDDYPQSDASSVDGSIKRRSHIRQTSGASSHLRQASAASVTSNSSNKRRLSFSARSNASAVEETLAEFNWSGRDDTLSLEMAIQNELASIEAANTHNVVDLDNRLDELDHSLSSAINECEKIDTMLAFFSVQLSAFSENISHIESQGQGLQVQTTNKKLLWNELHDILQSVNISPKVVQQLQKAKLESPTDIKMTESALMELYVSLKLSEKNEATTAGGDSLGSMRALSERRHVADQAKINFVIKFKSILEQKFKDAMRLNDAELSKMPPSEEPKIHLLEGVFMEVLYPLSGALLFLKEMDSMSYGSMVKTYEYVVRPYYESAISMFLGKWRRKVASIATTMEKFSFSGKFSWSDGHNGGSGSGPLHAKTIKRSGTLARLKTATGDHKGSLSPTTGADDNLSWTPDSHSRSLVRSSIFEVIKGVVTTIMSQQELIIKVLHQSSLDYNGFPEFVKKHPVSERMNGRKLITHDFVLEIDSDRRQARELQNIMSSIFSTVNDELMQFVDFFVKTCYVECPALIAIIDSQVHKIETTNHDFLMQLLPKLRDRASYDWHQFVDGQIKAIGNTLITSKKRKGVVYFVRVLPGFCKAIEEDLAEVEVLANTSVQSLPVRQTIDDAYDRIFKAVFHNLQRIAKEPSAGDASVVPSSHGIAPVGVDEDKEQLNYHIMMIENMNLIMEGLANETNETICVHRDHAMSVYRTELDRYVKTVIRRPLGKLLEFVEGVEAYADKNPMENPQLRHGYSRSAFKRLLGAYDAKEMKKSVEVLQKRVEKHFLGDEDRADKDPALYGKVWSSLQAEFSMFYSRLTKIVDRYYSDPNEGALGIDFSKADITQAFRR